MNRPRLSVVVPFYGVQDYIGDCLRSIQQQHLREIEVIMVDDGSPDGSRAVAQEFAAQDPRFRLVTQDNAGLGPARNTGVGHASAEYLSFIDSDDLVTQHSFERMVHALDTTGSSFVAGNARRFNNVKGVRPSWAHLRPFARTRFATHLYELPVLARDRMVWNKVYRRTFWDEFGYAFPPIRYEDYPVTLKAHLEAVTVDVLADPVYYWRERESGDSITQQVYRADNLLDRVASATMVLDLVRDEPEKVRRETHLMLAESDYIAIVQAFATVPDEDVDQVLGLGHDLVERLGFEAIQQRTRFDQLQYHALMRRDVELLRELALFRGGGGLRGGHRARRVGRSSARLEYDYPGADRSYLARDLFIAPSRELGLRTGVDHLQWQDGDLLLRGTAEIRHVASRPGSTIRVWAVSKTHRVPLAVERFSEIDSHGDLSEVGFGVRIGAELIRRFAETDFPMRLDVQVTAGAVSRTGLLKGLRSGSPQWRPGTWLEPDLWVQPTSTAAGELQLGWLREPWVLTEATMSAPGQVRLTARLSRATQVATLVLTGSRYAQELHYPSTCTVRDGGTILEAVLPLADVLAHTDDDDPYLKTTTRALQVRCSGVTKGLVWAAPPHSVQALLDEHQFLVTRSATGYATLRETAVRIVADEVVHEVVQGQPCITMRGRNSTPSTTWRFGWRRYLPGTEDYLLAPAEYDCTADLWWVRTRVSDLLGVDSERDPIDPLALLTDWSMFATDHDLDTAVIPDPFLLTQLPVWLAAPGRHGVVRPHSDTVHLEVRATSTIERR